MTQLPSQCQPAACCTLFWTVGAPVLVWLWSGSAADPKPGENSAAERAPTQNTTGTKHFD